MQKICYCAITYLYLHTLSITQKYNTVTFNIFISQKYLQNHPQIGTLPLIC